MNLTEQQPNKSAKQKRSLTQGKNGTRFQDDQGATNSFSQNLCGPKYRFVGTNIFPELRKLSQDGNAMDHSLLVLLMGNEIKIVAWRKFALAGNRTRAFRVAGENSTTEPPVLVLLGTLTSYKSTLWFGKKVKTIIA